MINVITTIAFDADDTLWVNEPYFQEVEKEFCSLLEDYLPQYSVSQERFELAASYQALPLILGLIFNNLVPPLQ